MQQGRVLEIQVKQAGAESNWVWGAFKMPGAVFHELYELWNERAGTGRSTSARLVNAWISRGRTKRWPFVPGQCTWMSAPCMAIARRFDCSSDVPISTRPPGLCCFKPRRSPNYEHSSSRSRPRVIGTPDRASWATGFITSTWRDPDRAGSFPWRLSSRASSSAFPMLSPRICAGKPCWISAATRAFTHWR